MPGERYPPRNLGLEDLIAVLVSEHAIMKEGLRRAKEATERRDFDSVSKALKELDPIFRQHIADEESQILRLLISKLGVKGAAEEIRVFQQHRPIYRLMEKVARLANLPTAELEADQTELNALFDEHTAAEELHVFPRVASLQKKQGL